MGPTVSGSQHIYYFTGAGGNLVALGPHQAIPGDFNDDGFVDNADHLVFIACATRDRVPYNPGSLPPGCTLTPSGGTIAADFDADGDVDMRDHGAFQRCYSGTAPGNPNCYP
jgi:hypothetical protein